MPKFTDTQLTILSKAAAHEDGAATVPERMNKGAATKLATNLVARKLMREIRAKPGMPVWREDDDGRTVSLIITRAGRAAIGVDEDPQAKGTAEIELACRKEKGEQAPPSNSQHDVPATSVGSTAPRSGSKQALVVEMLGGPHGATVDALVAATGWLPHTTRAVLTGLRKRGIIIERERPEGSTVSIYRIVADSRMAA